MAKSSIMFACRTDDEAFYLLRAVREYGKNLDDPAGYAPASEEGAGFGWDAVVRAALDMGRGSVTHMSLRMAKAFLDAITAYRDCTVNRDDNVHYVETFHTFSTLIEEAEGAK
jgi:hypothetical protein